MFNLLPLELWHTELVKLDESSLDCVIISDAIECDLLKMLGGYPEARRGIKVWKRGCSDIDTYCNSSEGRQAVPLSDASSPTHPVLGLLDLLDLKGYMCVQRRTTHTRRSVFFFDKHFQYVKQYLQCVLASAWIFSHGQDLFESRMPISYYNCLLKCPGPHPTP